MNKLCRPTVSKTRSEDIPAIEFLPRQAITQYLGPGDSRLANYIKYL